MKENVYWFSKNHVMFFTLNLYYTFKTQHLKAILFQEIHELEKKKNPKKFHFQQFKADVF